MRNGPVTRLRNFLTRKNRTGLSFRVSAKDLIWVVVGQVWVFLLHIWIAIDQASSNPCSHSLSSIYSQRKHQILFYPF